MKIYLHVLIRICSTGSAGSQCELPVVQDTGIKEWIKCQENQDQMRTEEPF